jgi:hypothetical protein
MINGWLFCRVGVGGKSPAGEDKDEHGFEARRMPTRNRNGCKALNTSILDELVKRRKSPFSVIPAPHPVRDKLQPESSLFIHLRGN